MPDSSYVLKLVKPRSWHERIKIYWQSGRLYEEIKGSVLFNRIGIRSASIISYGLSLPLPSNQYVGFYIMDNLQQQGYTEAASLFNTTQLNSQRRERILQHVLNDIAIMKAHHLVFTDLHLGQVFVTDEDNICWVDVGVKSYAKKNKSIFNKRFNRSLERFINDDFVELKPNEIDLIRKLGF